MENYGIKIDLLKLKGGIHEKLTGQGGDKTLPYYPCR